MQPLLDWMESTFGLAPEYGQALIIILASALVAALVDQVIRRVLLKLVARTESDLDDKIIDLTHRPIFFTVLALGVEYALDPLLETYYAEGALLTHTNVIETLIVLAWALLAVRIVETILSHAARREGGAGILQPGTVPLFANIFRLLVLGGVLYFMIGVWELDQLGWQPNFRKEYNALIIFVIFLAAALVADYVLRRILSQMADHTRSEVDDRILELIHKPVFLTILLVGFNQALNQVLVRADGTPGEIHTNIIKTLVVAVWVILAVRILSLILESLSKVETSFTLIQPATLPIFNIGMKVIVVGTATYFIMIAWGIDPAGWVASAGVVGITLGFAARDTIANLFAGIFILADAPYKIGDYIVLDSGERGKVTKIGIRSTRMLTRDDVEITVPNAVIADAKIVNQSGGPWVKFRIRIGVGVAYGSDVDFVEKTLLEVANADDEVCPSPAARVRFRELGDSSLNFELLAWVEDPELRGRVTHRLLGNVYKTFVEKGIEIPFPQRDLHFRSALQVDAREAEVLQLPQGQSEDHSEQGLKAEEEQKNA
ncbi:MAG TPA: mechanosensitive ion channel family protein [Acidobacteriota bacterium]|nr:mechanosensitive ion channel family protein [Acidobacteriota bacterium]